VEIEIEHRSKVVGLDCMKVCGSGIGGGGRMKVNGKNMGGVGYDW